MLFFNSKVHKKINWESVVHVCCFSLIVTKVLQSLHKVPQVLTVLCKSMCIFFRLILLYLKKKVQYFNVVKKKNVSLLGEIYSIYCLQCFSSLTDHSKHFPTQISIRPFTNTLIHWRQRLIRSMQSATCSSVAITIHTHTYTPMKGPLGAIWGSESCSRTLRLVDRMEPLTSDQSMTTLPPEPQT